jgi:hypothetical protein
MAEWVEIEEKSINVPAHDCSRRFLPAGDLVVELVCLNWMHFSMMQKLKNITSKDLLRKSRPGSANNNKISFYLKQIGDKTIIDTCIIHARSVINESFFTCF